MFIDRKNAYDKVIHEKLTNIFNRYIKFNAIPKEITTFRLFCLNKKANEPGDINNIIFIVSYIDFIFIIFSIKL